MAAAGLDGRRWRAKVQDGASCTRHGAESAIHSRRYPAQAQERKQRPMTYKCEPCDGANPVQVILTNLQSGATDQSCADDLPIMLIGQLAVYLEVNPEALYEQIRAFTDQVD